MIGVIVGSLALAGAITFMAGGSGSEGLKGIPEDKTQWVTCRNDKCGENYEMKMRDYYGQMEELSKKGTSMMLVAPALTCQKCNEESI